MSSLGKRRRDDESKTSVKRHRYTPSKAKAKMSVLSARGEMKSVDLSTTSITLAIDSTANKTLLNAPVPGSGLQNRLGRRIRMKSIHILGNIIQSQQGAAPTDDFVHVYLLYDMQPNAAVFATADFLQNCDSGGSTGTNNFSFINMSNAKRFKILRHYKRKFENGAGVSINQPSQDSTDFQTSTTLDMFVKLNDLDTQFNTGTAGTIADIQTGALYIMVIGANSNANSEYSFQYNARLRFLDS